jgi:MtN3 and saliva related transmembrane protein
MKYSTIVGLVAAACTTISFLPQALKVYRTKHTKDLSLPMYAIFSLGVFLWTCYGILLQSLPIVIANSATFILCVYIVAMKIRYR